MSPAPRYNLLGVAIAGIGAAEACERILSAARNREPFAASAVAVHAVMEAQARDDFRLRLNALDLAVPDGQPVRWAVNRMYGAGLAERVYGPFLMRDLCAAAARERLPVFLYGATGGTLDRLSKRLGEAHPGLVISGTRASRFRRATAQEAEADARAIAESGARIVFCGLGCPRQEAWVHAMRSLVAAPLVGVGAAFALGAGERTMAPAWMQRRGLEWLYRLGQEPARLAGRYLVQGPRFIFKTVLQSLGHPPPGIQPVRVSPDYWG